MFNIGDLIIYGNEGVCRVEAVGKPDNPGANRDKMYYTLAPVYQRGKILTPVDTGVFIRPVITRGEALKIIEGIPFVHAEIFNERNLKSLTDHYRVKIQSNDCIELVKTIKSINMKRSAAVKCGKKLGVIDERFLKRAENMLYGELAVVLETTPEGIRDALSDRLVCSEPSD